MRECLEGVDALVRVIREHLQDQVLEAQVVDGRVAHLVGAGATGSSGLHPQHVAEGLARHLGLWPMPELVCPSGAVSCRCKVFDPLGSCADHGSGGHAKELTDARQLVALVRAGEEGLSRVHLHEDAAQAPHVDLRGVGAAKQHLGRTIEARLDVAVHALMSSATRAKVDELDGRALGVAQEDVLRFEVAVDDGDLAEAEEAEALENLLGELAYEIQRDSSKVGVAEEVVEIIREHLEDKALVAAVHEVRQEAHDAGLVVGVLGIEELEELDLRLGLLQEGLLTLDDLDCNRRARHRVPGLHHLPKRALADGLVHGVAVREHLARPHDVVRMLVVVAALASAPAGRRRAALRRARGCRLYRSLMPSALLLTSHCVRARRPPLPLLVVHRVDVLVRVDEVDGQLAHGRRGRIPDNALAARQKRASSGGRVDTHSPWPSARGGPVGLHHGRVSARCARACHRGCARFERRGVRGRAHVHGRVPAHCDAARVRAHGTPAHCGAHGRVHLHAHRFPVRLMRAAHSGHLSVEL
mmetsp:Transcript_14083/g.37903  ORF Transcript_14083/g.37903 Transcript_14083/m.37903 type:complete len:528 (+) Transcript_14083:98-1681(+)